jgi:hypothetical protein
VELFTAADGGEEDVVLFDPGEGPAAESGSGGPRAEGDGGDLGDNVELF